MRSKKLIKGGKISNILIQDDINTNINTNPPTTLFAQITKLLDPKYISGKPSANENVNKIIQFLEELNTINPVKNFNGVNNIFEDINIIVNEYVPKQMTFQTSKFKNKETSKADTLFGKYELILKESNRNYITIDPTIIQILIFDDNIEDEDIVYSLKLIIRNNSELTLRYTTKLFPNKKIEGRNDIKSKIESFTTLTNFISFNKELDNKYFANFDKELSTFMKTYIKFYEFYKKCYKTAERQYVDYQLKYISILGKARFRNNDIINRTALLTDYIMSNLLFTSPAYGFISGGYKGFKDDAYGITRSGYEIAKKYNRPILTIMCKEGMHDAHEYSDATLIYGEHWGEDTIALSQLTDGAIIIAPFGGWTYVECLALLSQNKIVGIYNDLFNILNYEKKMKDPELRAKAESSYVDILDESEIKSMSEIYDSVIDDEVKTLKNINTNKNTNKNFFNFTTSEQNSIIDYYINYYLILLHILIIAKLILSKTDSVSIKTAPVDLSAINNFDKYVDFRQKIEPIYKENLKKLDVNFDECLILGIQILSHLKILFKAGQICLIDEKGQYVEDFTTLLEAFNKIKTNINSHVNANLDTINEIYNMICGKEGEEETYQIKIPKKCDGIWIKPAFDLIKECVSPTKAAELNAETIAKVGAEAKRKAAQDAYAANQLRKEKFNIDMNRRQSLLEYNFNAINTQDDFNRGRSKGKTIGKTIGKRSDGKSKSKSTGKRSTPTVGGGGGCTKHVSVPLLNIISEYQIDFIKLMNHVIFKNLNNNIIFVFSDILYLSSYLNTNLNISTFQSNMHKKITTLSKTYNGKSKKDLFASSFNLSTKAIIDDAAFISALAESNNPSKGDKFIELNRSIDGMYSTDRKEIIHHHIIREKYSFIIDNETCNNLIPKENTLPHPPIAQGGSRKTVKKNYNR
jgi:hypothetical protein